MSELPTPPFPELHALERKRALPALAELLGDSARLPVSRTPHSSSADRGPLNLPRFPSPRSNSPKREAPAEAQLEEIPVLIPEESMRDTLAALMEDDLEPLPEELSDSTEDANTDAPNAEDKPEEPPEDESTESPAGTDAELVEALQPLLDTSLSRAFTSVESGLQAVLEPMLRNTVRRAIAEQMESSRQFKQLGTLDRLGLRLLSLLTNRSYDELLFTRTRRYQVEELYLLQRRSRELLSYASHDPARHVSTRRVQPTVRMLSANLKGPDGTVESSFDLPERRLALVREGEHCLLVAILRGRSNALVRADLDYILRQIEDRFGARLEERSEAFLTVLQPLLESGLLIQSPAPPQ